MRAALLGVALLLTTQLGSCTYLKYAAVQAEYARLQEAKPGQSNLKHLIGGEKFYVIGRTTGDQIRPPDASIAIAAYSDKFRVHERVDTMHFQGNGTHFGLSLPAGHYQLVVFADTDNNKRFDQNEVIGQREITLNRESFADGVAARTDIVLSAMHTTLAWQDSFPTRASDQLQKSLFYPAGSIRDLDDPLFDEGVATLGMFDPASFLEAAPTMFYALEEDHSYKIPVIFVHGIAGTPRTFAPMIERLDRSKFKPWIFYYPSGGDLDHQAAFFYRLFLSGDVIPLADIPMIIVAHSMGGLVVREALNRYQGIESENRVELLVTIASPLGGHAAAAIGEKHGPLVLPAWRDLNPDNRFIRELYRKPLPEFVDHHLLYAYGNPKGLKIGENSDGVISLASQLHAAAQDASTLERGFNSGHTAVLANPLAIDHVIKAIESVKNPLPEQHLALLAKGGFALPPAAAYSPLATYYIREAGHYLIGLLNDQIKPIHQSQDRFIQAVRNPALAQTEVEKQLAQWFRGRSRPSPDRGLLRR